MNVEQSQVIYKIVCEWMRLANSDLAIAQIANDERISPAIPVFHAQQAVEKALKALLVQPKLNFRTPIRLVYSSTYAK